MAEYIEREAAIEAVRHAWAKGLEPSQYVEVISAADVSPVRHGRWLTWEEQFPRSTPKKLNNLGVFCDKCHNHADNRTDYCPNCGAKMDEEVIK